MKLVYEQSAFSEDLAKLRQWCAIKGYMVTLGEAWRPDEMQELYLKQGKTKTLHSNHCRRLAIDLNFFLNDTLITSKADLQEIGDYWESLSPENRWLGNAYKWFPNSTFIDCPHFERHVIL